MMLAILASINVFFCLYDVNFVKFKVQFSVLVIVEERVLRRDKRELGNQGLRS
jgi:hypothetical protein